MIWLNIPIVLRSKAPSPGVLGPGQWCHGQQKPSALRGAVVPGVRWEGRKWVGTSMKQNEPGLLRRIWVMAAEGFMVNILLIFMYLKNSQHMNAAWDHLGST